MFDSILASIVDYLQQRTAFPGWAAEFLVFFATFTLLRFAAALWNGTMLEGEPLWFVVWGDYDNLRTYAEDSLIPAVIFTILVEAIIMVLARKRMRLEREEGREEGRAEVRTELAPIIRDLQERVRQLENGGAATSPQTREP